MNDGKADGSWKRSSVDGMLYLYETASGRWWCLEGGTMLRVRASSLPPDVAGLDGEEAE